jgi:hypothetical protein
MLATNACGDDGDKEDGKAGDGDNTGDGDGDGDTPMDPKPLLPANTAGKACGTDNECGPTGKCAKELTGGMLASLASGFLDGADLSMATPTGYCTAVCKTDNDCGEGGMCFGILPAAVAGFLGGGATSTLSGECRQKCAETTECRAGENYECAKFNKAALAESGLPAALTGFIDIPPSCQPAPTVEPIDDSIVGKACSTDEECGAGSCLGYEESADGGAPTQGRCTAVCATNTDCGASQGVCTGILYGSAGTCVETCTKDTDCKVAGDTCEDAFGVMVCTPGEPEEEEEEETDAGTDAG